MKSIVRIVAAILFCVSLPVAAQGFFAPKSSTGITDFYPGWSAPSGALIKTPDGFVHMRGFLQGDLRVYDGKPYAWKVFVLPVGYRPAIPEYFVVAADGAPAAINVMPDGWVWVATNSSIWVALSGVSFQADH